MNILFITWDGPQVSYLEGLFLPIFRELKKNGDFSFHILQFTWDDSELFEYRRAACESAGCSYERVSVIRKPNAALGSLLSAAFGYRHVRKAINKYNIDIVMPRSTLPAFTSLIALRSHNIPMLFDADGLPLDERVDFTNLSTSSPVYRLLRDIEAQAVRQAASVITRSKKASDILLSRAGAGTNKGKFHVVTNGRNTDLFNPGDKQSRDNTRAQLSISPSAPLLVYAGSIGPQYCITQMLKLFELIKTQRVDAHLLILTGSLDAIRKYLKNKPDLAKSITTMSVAANQVHSYLACADLGIAFREPSFSMQGVAPIKLGEYLLCGLPVVATRDIGDTHMINKQVGILVDDMQEDEIKDVASWFINEVLPSRNEMRHNCRRIGYDNFSLIKSSEKYKSVILNALEGAHE